MRILSVAGAIRAGGLAVFLSGLAGPVQAGGGIEWIPVPFPIHTPETGLAMTLSVIATRRTEEGLPSSLTAFSAWSERNQKNLSVNPRVYLGGDWLIEGRLAVQDWPTDYFGLGNATREEDGEVYTTRGGQVGVNALRRVGASTWIGPRATARHARIRDLEPGGLLDTDPPPGLDGGWINGLGLAFRYDTRNDAFAPDAGLYLALQATWYDGAWGSDYTFRELTLDARQFIGLTDGWVLALNQHLAMNRGDVPFTELAKVGNQAPPSRMRGHITGRFLDRDAAVVQAELRYPIWRRFTGVAFVGAGDVAPSLDRLRASDIKWTGGAGLRFRLSRAERINLRFDAALAEDESGVYFSLTEAF